jgi:hypothetical protein
MGLSKSDLQAKAKAAGLPRDTVPIPEFGDGVTVIVQGMSGTQRDGWERSLLVGRGARRDINTENIRARLVVKCLVNEDGTRLFEDSDAATVGEWRVDVLQRLFEVAQRLSGVSDGDIDELKKSSETAAGSGSPTN